jgi:hypothetical protein
MSTLEFDVDFGPILEQFAGQAQSLAKELEMGVQALAASTHAHVLEKAAQVLHSRRETYVKATTLDRIAPNVWAVTLHKDALFIEEGMAEHSMIPGFMNSDKVKTARDGSKFLVIPFAHNKTPTQQTTQAQSITGMLRAELKARKIPYQKIEKDISGKPKTGLLHSLNLGGPQREATALNAAWESPALNGVRIYQHLIKSKGGKESARRDIVTFRIASSKHFGLKWNYPEKAGIKLLDEALSWCEEQWTKEILPSILGKT